MVDYRASSYAKISRSTRIRRSLERQREEQQAAGVVNRLGDRLHEGDNSSSSGGGGGSSSSSVTSSPQQVYDETRTTAGNTAAQAFRQQSFAAEIAKPSPTSAARAAFQGRVNPVDVTSGRVVSVQQLEVSGGVGSKLARESTSNPQTTRDDVAYLVEGRQVKDNTYKVQNVDREAERQNEQRTASRDSRTDALFLPSNKISSEEAKSFEEKVDESIERGKKASEAQGFKNIDEYASILTQPKFFRDGSLLSFDYNNRVPYEKRSLLGQSAELGINTGLNSGLGLGQLAVVGGERIAAFGEGLFKSRRESFEEFKTGPGKLEKGPFSFLPGGTPINAEGVVTLGGALIGALEARPVLASSSPLKVKTIKIATAEADNVITGDVIGSDFNIRNLGSAEIISSEPVLIAKSTPDFTVTVIGLEVGSRAKPLLTVIPDTTGELRVSPSFSPGKKPVISEKIKVSEIANSKGLDQPADALSAKIFDEAIDFTSAEKARSQAVVDAGRILGTDKGLTVKEAFFNIKGLKNPGRASSIIENFLSEEGGIVFGSSTTSQLPKGFRTLNPGDVDTFFPKKTVEEIAPKIGELTKQLQDAGEDVRLSELGEGTIIEFTSGEKFLEAKSGINQASLGLDDAAPTGVRGLAFPNLKAGGFGKTVPFGKARAFTAGEQFLRKGAGSLIVSPGRLPGETGSFSEIGILGRQGNPRGLKDVAGFIQSGKGLVEIRKDSFNPFKRLKGQKANEALDKFLETYSDAQQSDILIKLSESIGNENRVPLSFSKSKVLEGSRVSPSLIKSTLGKSFGGSTAFSPSSLKSPISRGGSGFSSGSPSASSIGSSSALGSPSSNPISRAISNSPISKIPSGISQSPSPLTRSISPSFSPGNSPYLFLPLNPSFNPDRNKKEIPPFKPSDEDRSFGVIARSKGKFFTAKQGLSFSDALKLSKGLAENSAIRTVGVTQGGNLVRSNLGGQFYTKGGLNIEKSKFAINTGGEYAQITSLGLDKIRRRKNVLGLVI